MLGHALLDRCRGTALFHPRQPCLLPLTDLQKNGALYWASKGKAGRALEVEVETGSEHELRLSVHQLAD